MKPDHLIQGHLATKDKTSQKQFQRASAPRTVNKDGSGDADRNRAGEEGSSHNANHTPEEQHTLQLMCILFGAIGQSMRKEHQHSESPDPAENRR